MSCSARFAGMDKAALKALPVLQAYQAYYKRFDKTYHSAAATGVGGPQGQKPSRALPPWFETMFVAELKNQLLTAGHDLGPVATTVEGGCSAGQRGYLMVER
jgi:hypothetical protein